MRYGQLVNNEYLYYIPEICGDLSANEIANSDDYIIIMFVMEVFGLRYTATPHIAANRCHVSV